MRFALLMSLMALACTPKPPSPAEAEAPPLGQTGGEATDLMEVRMFRVAWAGAEDAPARVTRSEEEAQDRARTIAALLRSPGSNFGEVAREYGDTSPVIERLERATADETLFRVTGMLAVGDTSRPIRTERGFVIVQRRADPLGGPSTVGARHILIAYAGARRAADTVTRSREEAIELARQLSEEARGGADWVALHEEHTDEPGSPPGGDLGTFGRGQMVPSFERAVFSMQPGETTVEPVETPFGFHVIQRTE